MNQLQMETGNQLLHGKIMQCKIYHNLSIVDDTETRLECENNPQHHLARKQTVFGTFTLVLEPRQINSNNRLEMYKLTGQIEVSHYLKLDGKIDLVGRSQLQF
jgi:hypothetical protein